MRAFAALGVLAACGPHHTVPVVDPPDGISIAYYAAGGDGLAVIDDRREIEVTGDAILLDRIDDTTSLPSLVIEPIGTRALAIGACARERLALPAAATKPADPDAPAPEGVLSPLVRCTVRGAPGRYRVRVLYTTKATYTVRHDVSVSGERATVSTRFALGTPAWRARAVATLYEGLPGSEVPPRELARGSLTLDGGTSVLSEPAREVAARVRHVFDGGVRNDVESSDITWRRDSRSTVWVTLELEAIKLPAGSVHVHLELGGGEARDIDVPEGASEQLGGALRVPLWVDEQLRGTRQHWVERADGVNLTDRFTLAVSNLGDQAREVWVEEHLRTAKRQTVLPASRNKPQLAGPVARNRVVIAPRSTERVSYAIHNEL